MESFPNLALQSCLPGFYWGTTFVHIKDVYILFYPRKQMAAMKANLSVTRQMI